MDPITHAVVGAGIFALSGGKISLSQPALIGCVAGSLAPDIDIIAKVRNDYYYLKHHRGSSHSIAGVLLLSVCITGLIALLYRGSSLPTVLAWTFAGGFIHVILDFLNSYGAQLLWPFSRKKYSLSLLKIFDIFIVMAGIAMLFSGKGSIGVKMGIMAVSGLYITALGIMRKLARRRIWAFFKGRIEQKNIKVLPALLGFFEWDFIIIAPKHVTVGRVHLLRRDIMVIERRRLLQKKEKEKFMENRAAGFFKEFTPIYHIGVRKRTDTIEVVYTDLRYRLRNGFMHHATAKFNSKGALVECIFHPFSKDKRIPF